MQFLTTKQISGEIERVIREAQKTIVLVSPYVEIDPMYIHRLQDAGNRGVFTRFIFRSGQEDKMPWDFFSSLRDIEIYSSEKLHAKCYLNESFAVVTSMNLYKFSEQNNREMGLVIDRMEHDRIYTDIVAECDSIRNTAQRQFIPKRQGWSRWSHNQDAYCIRCRVELDPDPSRPLCRRCYNEWAYYQNCDYEERFCHMCGKSEPSSMSKPLCLGCSLKYSG